jgi:hypothetical protein
MMIQEVIRHRLGVPEHEHLYFDDLNMVGPGEKRYLGQRWAEPIPSMI